MECDQLPASETWDQAAPEELNDYRLHVRFCAGCRARILREAPDQLLFDLRNDLLPQDFWLGFWNSIHQKRAFVTPASSGQSSSSGARKMRALQIYPPIRWAAVLVIGFLILLYGRNLPETEPVRQLELDSYPVIENIENPEARYYIFQSGDQKKIVMVFDPDMEL